MRFRAIRKQSDRGKLRKEIGAIHLKILKFRRGPQCEICQTVFGDVARFHILTVAAHPKLEFVDENVLLYSHRHWYTCHEPYHHDRDSKLGQMIMRRIVELRGPDYKQKLLEREHYVGKMDGLYLRCLKETMSKELASMKGDL